MCRSVRFLMQVRCAMLARHELHLTFRVLHQCYAKVQITILLVRKRLAEKCGSLLFDSPGIFLLIQAFCIDKAR